jgi:hypothetical protein
MLSVIVTLGDSERLVGLLAALTPAAVEGFVREVRIVAGPPPELMDMLCDETGAEPAANLKQAAAAARSDWLLVVPPELRLRDGWVERLGDHLRSGVREAVLQGQGGGLFQRAPYGLVVTRKAVTSLAHPDLQRLRRNLGRGAARIG